VPVTTSPLRYSGTMLRLLVVVVVLLFLLMLSISIIMSIIFSSSLLSSSLFFPLGYVLPQLFRSAQMRCQTPSGFCTPGHDGNGPRLANCSSGTIVDCAPSAHSCDDKQQCSPSRMSLKACETFASGNSELFYCS
jgi:hypothetical protein